MTVVSEQPAAIAEPAAIPEPEPKSEAKPETAAPTDHLPPTFSLRGLVLLARHQGAAVAATALDFSVMIVLVSLVNLHPDVATAFGALCGAILSFSLGRHWIFNAADGHAGAQVVRYAIVSAVSLGLNVLGEHVLYASLGIQYVLARVMVAGAVGVLWNYPLHRYFVFPVAKQSHETEAKRAR